MKKPLPLAFVLLVLITLPFFSNCHYDNLTILPSSNIILYDKPLDVIKVNIAGKWKLNYRIGGLSGNERTDYDTTYFEFQFQTADTFIRIDTGKVTLNTLITWGKPTYAPYGSYIMSWPLNPIQFDLYAKEIKDNVLILSDICPDCYTYYLSRVAQ